MVSAPPNKSAIFRKEAIQKYVQGREKNILPHFVTPPVFWFLWCLLALFVSAGATAWLGRVPVYVTGGGVLLNTNSSGGAASNEETAVLFIPASSPVHLAVNEAVQMRIGQTGPQVSTAIDAIAPGGPLSPSEIRSKFLVSTTDPSLVLTAKVQEANISIYTGSLVQAQIEVGTRRLLSLFPGFTFLKDS